MSHTTDKIYDIIILGAGPAGLTASIYAARYKLSCLVLGSDIGGTANTAHDVQNWPGFQGNGLELMENFKKHAIALGVKIKLETVKKLNKDDCLFSTKTNTSNYLSKTIIIASGTKRRKLGIPGEKKFFGKGVSYCATCDCHFFKDLTVTVIGGSNCAAMAAQILAQHAKKVYIIYRQNKLRAETARVEELESNPKVEFIYNANVIKINGTEKVDKLILDTGNEVETDGVFIEIGGTPVSAITKELGIELDKNERIKTNAGMETNIPGVYASGDVTTGSNQFDQIITAAAEGSIAALSVFKSLREKKTN